MELNYNFPGLENAASQVTLAVNQLLAGVDRLRIAVHGLEFDWGSDSKAQNSWAEAQQKWNKSEAEARTALASLGTAIQRAGAEMQATDVTMSSQYLLR